MLDPVQGERLPEGLRLSIELRLELGDAFELHPGFIAQAIDLGLQLGTPLEQFLEHRPSQRG